MEQHGLMGQHGATQVDGQHRSIQVNTDGYKSTQTNVEQHGAAQVDGQHGTTQVDRGQHGSVQVNMGQHSDMEHHESAQVCMG